MLIEALMLLTRQPGLHLLIWYRVKRLWMWVMRLLLPDGVVWIRALPVICRQNAMLHDHRSFVTDPGLKLRRSRLYPFGSHRGRSCGL